MHTFQVKHIYYHCDRYRGLSGNYENDIAILEVTPPLTLSNRLVPVCLDSKDEIKLENGMYGKVAGFGRTASGEFSAMLQQITVPYVCVNILTVCVNIQVLFLKQDKYLLQMISFVQVM